MLLISVGAPKQTEKNGVMAYASKRGRRLVPGGREDRAEDSGRSNEGKKGVGGVRYR